MHAKYIHTSPALWFLKTAVDDLNLDTKILEWTINGDSNAFARLIAEQQPTYVGFSCYIWNIKFVMTVIEKLQQLLPCAVVILGGPEVSFRPKDILKENGYIDYCIVGEGEKPLHSLMDAFLKEVDTHNIPGIVSRSDQNVIECKAEKQISIPPVDIDGYAKSLNGRIAYIESSRGCPFSCAFCLSGRNESVRFVSIERTIAEIDTLVKNGAKIIKFVDRTFNCNKEHAMAIFQYLIQHSGVTIPTDVRFHFEVGADLFDRETLDVLKAAPTGLFQMEAGLQSFYEKTLLAVQRKTNMVKLIENITELIEMENIHIHIDLIAGLPEEDLQRFKQSFNQAFALRPHMLQLGFLKLLYGSKLRQDAEDYGYIFDPNPPYEFIKNNWMDQTDRQEIHCVEDAMERLYNSHRFLLTIQYLQEATQIAPFDLFWKIGKEAQKKNLPMGCALDDYTDFVFKTCKNMPGVNDLQLRNVMVMDRIASNTTGKLPRCLRFYDDRLKGLVQKYRKQTGHPCGAALIYGEDHSISVVWADYTKKEALYQRYILMKDDFPL